MKSTLFYIIILIVLLGLNLVAGLLLINSSSQNRISVSHLEALSRNQQNLDTLEKNLETYSAKINLLATVLPKQTSIPDFIQFISDSATQLEISHTFNFTTDLPTQNKDKLWTIPISINLTQTTPANLQKFITTVKSSTYQLRFSHLETSTIDDQINARLSGILFVSDQFSL